MKIKYEKQCSRYEYPIQQDTSFFFSEMVLGQSEIWFLVRESNVQHFCHLEPKSCLRMQWPHIQLLNMISNPLCAILAARLNWMKNGRARETEFIWKIEFRVKELQPHFKNERNIFLIPTLKFEITETTAEIFLN